MTFFKAMELVQQERTRQECLAREGKFAWTCAADNVAAPLKLAVLAEEFDEVAKEACELQQACDRGDIKRAMEVEKNLITELVQVAACCVAWLESL